MGTKKLDTDEEYISIGLKPSTKLDNGHYEILSNLGEPGGFGITYLGYDCKLNSKVAIKEYFPRTYANRNKNMTIVPTDTKEDKADFQWGYNAFKKEAQTIANLEKHPNIIDVKNLFEENGTIYFVMSYAQGVDLEAYLSDHHPLTQKEIEEIIYPFLEGVQHIHKYNLLHRDIKLANILITKNRQPILIDFGTARNELIQRSKKMTSVYTEGYASLEQHTQSKEGPYTDIYAIGMLIYALMNGITDTKLLPSAIKRFEAMHSKKASLLTFPDDKRFNKIFINAVKKALEIKKENRPQNIQEFINLLKKGEDKSKNSILLISSITALILIGGATYIGFYKEEFFTLESEKLFAKERREPIEIKKPLTVIPKVITVEKTEPQPTPNNLRPESSKIKKEEIIREKVIDNIALAEKAIIEGKFLTAIKYLKKEDSTDTPLIATQIAKLYDTLGNQKINTIKWYEIAKKRGYIKAKYPLAILYCKQGNFKKFQSKDILQYAKNARREVKYDVGLCYNEIGNMTQAIKWLKASTVMGYSPAKETLYKLLTQEMGKNNEEAIKIIKNLK